MGQWIKTLPVLFIFTLALGIVSAEPAWAQRQVCMQDSECDDGDACTDDTCTVPPTGAQGACSNTPKGCSGDTIDQCCPQGCSGDSNSASYDADCEEPNTGDGDEEDEDEPSLQTSATDFYLQGSGSRCSLSKAAVVPASGMMTLLAIGLVSLLGFRQSRSKLTQ